MRHTPTILSTILGLMTCVGLATQCLAAGDAIALAEQIDRHIQDRLDVVAVERVPPAADGEFLRRVFLDLHGVAPSAERVSQFFDSSSNQKRAQLIDELLGESRYGEYFADVWRQNLLSPAANEQRTQPERFAGWLAGRFNASDGWDRIVFDLLTAAGKMEENLAVTYLIEGRFPLGVTDLTDLSSRYFLGVRLNCAQCHDHPFVAWKRQDYWGMAAFFAEIQTPNRPKMVYVAGVRDDPQMSMAKLQGADMIEGFQNEPPTFLGGEPLKPTRETPRREALARWTTSAENPYFARAAVNRLWWHFFGRGLVAPVDDMHSGNQPSHPELLELLSRKFAESGFDLKFLCRAILNSRTYQQTSRPGEQADREAELFARMSIKVLSGEQLYDSLVQILGPPAKTASIDARVGARSEFGQFFAGSGDPDPTRYDRGIPHLLRLMNSPQFAGRSVSALAERAAASGRTADQTTEALFLAILARRPTDAERQLTRQQLVQKDASPADVYRELAWVLLMSSEFSLNH